DELHLSEDAAFKRIRAARLARRFPSIYCAVAEGRLHLSALVLLKPYLTDATEATAAELLAAVTHRSKSQIERLLAERFPTSEMLPMAEALPARQPQPGQTVSPTEVQLAPGPVAQVARHRVSGPALRSKTAPIATERFLLQLTIGQSTHEKLHHAQSLLSHRIPSGDLAEVLERVLDLAIVALEKQ